MDYYKDALRRYAEFTGRTARRPYWMFVLVNFIVSIIVGIIGSIVHIKMLGNIYSLILLIPSLAIGARRLHDIGKSGWWLLLVLIPVLGWIVLLVFAVTDSQPGDNQYGPNPKGQVPPVAPVTPVV